MAFVTAKTVLKACDNSVIKMGLIARFEMPNECFESV